MQRPTSIHFGAGVAVPQLRHAGDEERAREPKRRRGRGDSVALWIIALSTAWLALVVTALLLVTAVKAPALGAAYAHAEGVYTRGMSAVASARSAYEGAAPRFARFAPSDDTLHWAGVLGEALARWLRSGGLDRMSQASERASEWAQRLEHVYHDKRIEVVSRAATDVSNLIETRGSALLADFEQIANTTHALVRRGARRMHALEELLLK